MINKHILLASFVPKDKIDWFLDLLHFKLRIDKKYVYIFDCEEEDQVMLTYSVKKKNEIDLKSFVFKTLIIHKKGSTIYTINALNKLIEEENDIDSANIIHKNFKVDWDKYKNKLILIDKNSIVITSITRVFS